MSVVHNDCRHFYPCRSVSSLISSDNHKLYDGKRNQLAVASSYLDDVFLGRIQSSYSHAPEVVCVRVLCHVSMG